MSRCQSPLRYLPSSPIRRTLRRWDVEQPPFTVVEMDLCGRRPPLLTKPHELLRSFSLTGTIFLSIRSHFARIQSSSSQYFTSTNQVLTTSHVVFISTFTEGLLQKPPYIHQISSDSSTAVTSHAAVNSDARSIQIYSQYIRIRH